MPAEKAPEKILTTFWVIRPEENYVVEYSALMDESPSFDEIRRLVEPHLGDADMERVRVLFKGSYVDMFVDEMSVLKELPHNELATTIYRNDYLTAHPDCDPDDLPFIAGVAVVFSRAIWR